MTISNMAIEWVRRPGLMGSRCETLRGSRGRGREAPAPALPMPMPSTVSALTFDASVIGPQWPSRHAVDNVSPIRGRSRHAHLDRLPRHLHERPVGGSCHRGSILERSTRASGRALLVAPASRRTLLDRDRGGLHPNARRGGRRARDGRLRAVAWARNNGVPSDGGERHLDREP